MNVSSHKDVLLKKRAELLEGAGLNSLQSSMEHNNGRQGDMADQASGTIRKVTPGGVVTTRAGTCGESGSTDGIGAAARFNMPYGVAVDTAGNVYVVNRGNSTIQKVTPTGTVTTLAGLAGTTIMFNTVELNSPKTTTMAKGVWISLPG